MYGTENELVMVTIKMRLITFFSCLTSSASFTIHGETHGGGQVVPSRMVLENGAIGFECTIFLLPTMSLQRARSMDASHSGREPQHWQKEGGAAFLQ